MLPEYSFELLKIETKNGCQHVLSGSILEMFDKNLTQNPTSFLSLAFDTLSHNQAR
ncbi:hypothetical protein KDK_47310 [Dictyobacter kobayashii]|uniref:Uncharacterized protein n=1 Tax=Dictyobacter kobayashii TaxID=2014872 RepID=A0A402AP06_9CHLR|nr:hypothetical protein KDK_47310 [Dictyobacter kobayashii]